MSAKQMAQLPKQTLLMPKERRANFLRRLHSLCGVVPLGIFLIFHIFLNYSARWGVDTYDMAGNFMANLPYKILLETFVIFLPLLFHAVYGVYISLTSGYNGVRYTFFDNVRFVFQRITGIIAFIFVVWHIYGTKLQVEIQGIDPTYSMVHNIVSTPAGLIMFAVGLLCVVYHFVNGCWSFLITWGITVSPRSQYLSKVILSILFVVFAAFALVTLFLFV